MKKSSNDWWHDDPQFQTMRIMDPDGWDRENLQYSFYEEKVTHEEFENRLLRSTMIPREKPTK